MTAPTSPPGDLWISLHLAADGVVVTVRGELDVVSAPDVQALLDAAVDRGHHRIDVVCDDLTFLDAAGLGALAAVHGRLGRAGGGLRLRGLAGMPRRLVEITSMTDPLQVADPPPALAVDLDHAASDRLVDERPVDEPLLGERLVGERLVGEVSRLAGESARADGRVVVLAAIAEVAPAVVGACDAATVTLRRGPHLVTAAASDESIRLLDRRQYATHSGPCVEATDAGTVQHASLREDGDRWRAFTRAARAEGMQAVLSTPLTVRGRPTGALNLYSRRAPLFGDPDRHAAEALAAIASSLFEDGDDPTGGWLDAEVRQALACRDVLAQAEGIVMARLGVGPDVAFDRLRDEALALGLPLVQRAFDVVDGSRRRAGEHRATGAGGA